MTDFHTYLYQIAFINGDAAGMQQQLDWSKGRPDEYLALDWQASAMAFTGQWRKTQDERRAGKAGFGKVRLGAITFFSRFPRAVSHLFAGD